MNLQTQITADVIELLKSLIACPSMSKEENGTAAIISEYLSAHNIPYFRKINNIWAKNKYYNKDLPTVLLNSHHDTVKPNPNWTLDPFAPTEKDGKIYGLGSNDAGASLVSLLAVFHYYYYRTDLQYNLLFVASAEEEITGKNGLELLFKENDLPKINFAMVGEPTQMQMAIAEKGLMVLDCSAKGIAGHAARNEGDNAIYKSIKDINWIQNYQFQKSSELLGPVKMSVTIINAGSQHNVVPAECNFTIDVRANDQYSLEDILETISHNIDSEVVARSMRLQPSKIDPNHPIVLSGKKLGLSTYGSPTTSDQAVIPYPSIKIGPGDSARSHTADEYIFITEIEEGIDIYIKMLKEVII
ncbi:MAG: M20 family metallo-hydrolase [Bacteroidota bacterium]